MSGAEQERCGRRGSEKAGNVGADAIPPGRETDLLEHKDLSAASCNNAGPDTLLLQNPEGVTCGSLGHWLQGGTA